MLLITISSVTLGQTIMEKRTEVKEMASRTLARLSGVRVCGES